MDQYAFLKHLRKLVRNKTNQVLFMNRQQNFVRVLWLAAVGTTAIAGQTDLNAAPRADSSSLSALWSAPRQKAHPAQGGGQQNFSVLGPATPQAPSQDIFDLKRSAALNQKSAPIDPASVSSLRQKMKVQVIPTDAPARRPSKTNSEYGYLGLLSLAGFSGLLLQVLRRKKKAFAQLNAHTSLFET